MKPTNVVLRRLTWSRYYYQACRALPFAPRMDRAYYSGRIEALEEAARLIRTGGGSSREHLAAQAERSLG